jgi:hypothetical protein
MKTKPKPHHWRCLLPLVVLATSGCSGVNVTKSVSPLDFLLPGLHVQNPPPAPAVPDSTNALVCGSPVLFPYINP